MEDKWKRIEDFERNPEAYGHLIFDQIAKNHPVEIRQHFQQKVLIQIAVTSLSTKFKNMWTKDLHIKADTLKLKEE